MWHCMKIILCPDYINLIYSTKKHSSQNTENLAYFPSDVLWMSFEDTASFDHPLEMPGGDSDQSDSEHKEGWTGVLISCQRHLTESQTHARADIEAFKVKACVPVLE